MKEIKKCKSIEQLKKKVKEFNLGKKDLMNIAYNGNTQGVDSAIPKEYWSNETFWLVMDYKTEPFGKIVHLGQKILNDNKFNTKTNNSKGVLEKIREKFSGFKFTISYKAGQWQIDHKNEDMLITIWHNPATRFGIVMTHRKTARQIMRGQQSKKQIELILKDYENIKNSLS